MISSALAKPECIAHAFRTSGIFAAMSSITLNILLACVVIHCKTKDLRMYSKLILLNCMADTLFAVATYVAEIVRLQNGKRVWKVPFSMPISAAECWSSSTRASTSVCIRSRR